MKQKLAVLFPGIGYHCDKPLLHYARRIFSEAGYEIVMLRYDKDTFENARVTEAGVKRGYKIAVKALDKIDFLQYEDIVFIGKSVGTLIASMIGQALEKEVQNRLRYIQLTPLAKTFPYMQGQTVWAASGTKDPVISKERLLELSAQYRVPLHFFENANHSLEIKNAPLNSVSILAQVVEQMQKFADYD